MNGRIITNHVDHLDNFKKMQENSLITSENAKNSRKSNHTSLSGGKDYNLGTIQEELQDINGKKDSSGDEDVSSLTSATDSDSDASLSDSSDEEVEFFPPKKSSDKIYDKQPKEMVPSQNGGSRDDVSTDLVAISRPLSSDDTVTRDTKNSHDVTVSNNHNTVVDGTPQAHKEQNDLNIQTQNKLPKKLKPLHIARHDSGEKQGENESLSQSGLQSVPTSTNNYSEQSTGESSDVVIPSAHNPPDLIKGNLNGSGTLSDESDSKDHARILAELQKIVQDDELHESNVGGQSNFDGDTGGNDSDTGGIDHGASASTDGVAKDPSQSNELTGKNDGGFNQVNTSTNDDGTLSADLKTGDTNAHSDGTKHAFDTNDHHVGKNTMEDNNTLTEVGSNVKSTKNEPSVGNNSKNKHDHGVTIDGHKDGTKLQSSSQSSGTSHHGNSPNSDGTMLHSHDVNNRGTTSQNGHQQFDGTQWNDTTEKVPENMKTEGTKIRSGASNSLHTTPNASNTSLQPANFANQDHNLGNLEKKLSDLEISNTEQTTEIRRLKSLNQTLKTKFEKLEQSSSYHQNIEEKMLQRNEELEKHLLGMLKSSEIIFDMKENLKTASADNEKLTKDYKEAVKALEAVDKLVGVIISSLFFTSDKVREHKTYERVFQA